jgi:hypothetical protein
MYLIDYTENLVAKQVAVLKEELRLMEENHKEVRTISDTHHVTPSHTNAS